MNQKVRRFEDLNVWKEGMRLTGSIYRNLKHCQDFSLRAKCNGKLPRRYLACSFIFVKLLLNRKDMLINFYINSCHS